MFSLERSSSGTFIIAEVGLNHNGDFGLAVESIEAAAEAGADAVKFQNYRTEDFLFDRSLTYTYLSVHNEVFAIVRTQLTTQFLKNIFYASHLALYSR